jgi:hypothetical protein
MNFVSGLALVRCYRPSRLRSFHQSYSFSPVASPDEIRLIREYIKLAPFNGPTAQPINVGDPVTIGTIPLPSPLTDKIPKLLGARFTSHNGTIILVKRDSHQADAVLGPN